MPTTDQVVPNTKSEILPFLGDVMGKVQAMNALFITAGYGVFFGVWSIVKGDIALFAKIWAALFLVASASIFIGWHVIGMVALNRTISKVAGDPFHPGWVAKAKIAIGDNAVRLGRWWPMALTVIFGTEIVGVGILVAGLLSSLAKGLPAA
jgi:hypothetical protein